MRGMDGRRVGRHPASRQRCAVPRWRADRENTDRTGFVQSRREPADPAGKRIVIFGPRGRRASQWKTGGSSTRSSLAARVPTRLPGLAVLRRTGGMCRELGFSTCESPLVSKRITIVPGVVGLGWHGRSTVLCAKFGSGLFAYRTFELGRTVSRPPGSSDPGWDRLVRLR